LLISPWSLCIIDTGIGRVVPLKIEIMVREDLLKLLRTQHKSTPVVQPSLSLRLFGIYPEVTPFPVVPELDWTAFVLQEQESVGNHNGHPVILDEFLFGVGECVHGGERLIMELI